MASTRSVPVSDLKLDLRNFRTVPQADEVHAVQAMISINADRFWALMESLIDDGYLPTENILVLEDGTPSVLVVKEGNRRIASLKLIHGLLPTHAIPLPDNIRDKISKLSPAWKTANERVPCNVYAQSEAATVDRIVTLAHGKGEKAGRDQWTAVARARHNRDVNKINEPALDLLEAYLASGRNLTDEQRERWSGTYPLTVLEEAMKRVAPRIGQANAPALAKAYPSVQHRDALDAILSDIGLEVLGFKQIRSPTDFAASYGVPAANSAGSTGTTGVSGGGTGTAGGGGTPATGAAGTTGTTGAGVSGGAASTGSPATSATAGTSGKKTAAVAINDPKSVRRTLRKFVPRGSNRDKVVTLRDEALQLNLEKNPIAFCFLLRSMFEISAKAYCADHNATGGPSCTKSDGSDRKLADTLKDVADHLAKGAGGKPDSAVVKLLHGAKTELSKPDGLLSVTSMNQLVHNPRFSITAGDISTLFGNVYPLLEAMNK